MTHGPLDAPTYVVFGAGGHAASVQDVIESNAGRVLRFVGTSPQGCVDGEISTDQADSVGFARSHGHGIVIAIGDNNLRLKVASELAEGGLAEPIIASSATVSARAELGAGTTVHHHAHVGPGAVVGAHVIVNTGAIIEHGCWVGDGSHIAPGAAVLGDARIGPGTLVGAHSTVLPGVHVGAGAIVGAGAVVASRVPDGATVVGLPARPLHAES